MASEAIRRKVVITNAQGLHARPADQFVRLAKRYDCGISLLNGSERVDGKSIIGLLTLGAACGTELTLEAEGPEAEDALCALEDLIARGFPEESDSDGKSTG